MQVIKNVGGCQIDISFLVWKSTQLITAFRLHASLDAVISCVDDA